MSRHNTIKDLRSRIKHENTSLGSGTAAHQQQQPDVYGGPSYPARRHQQQPSGTVASSSLGAGPSFMSLSPSDSVSQVDGKTGHGGHGSGGGSISDMRSFQHGGGGGPYAASNPTHQSTASFAMVNQASAANAIGRPSSPLRPARSVRRPQQAPAVDGMLERSNTTMGRPSLRIVPGGVFDASASRSQESPTASASRAPGAPGRDLLSASRSQQQQPADRHARSAQLMAQVAQASAQPDGGISSGDEDDIYGGISPIEAPENGGYFPPSVSGNRLSVPGATGNRNSNTSSKRQSGAPLGSLTHGDEPAALSTVLSALSAAGRKHQAARIMRGTTAEEETRRRKTEKKISDVQAGARRPLEEYVKHSDDRGFQEINAVLRKVKAEWPFVADDDFNSVALALSMLYDSSLGASRRDFDSIKEMIESALQGTVDDHYESFATAITLHNSVLLALTGAQNSVSGARRRLRDSREALGAKRADLVQMWQRSQAVKESLRLLDIVEHLKGVPDRLENLMAEKRFLQAVNLLVRSLKTIDKPEIVEVGATSDLRAYLKGQEQAMLEILIEELHNHLYLKSYFCDARWKSYVAGQESLPAVDFGIDYAASTADQSAQSSPNPDGFGQSQETQKGLKLSRYLRSLGTRPSFDPNLASDIQDVGMTTSASMSALTGEVASNANGTTMSASKSVDSGIKVAGDSFGLDVGAAEFDQNPEADSFLYIEMLLESLARLGKLGTALEIISQRLAIEVHQLVDATIDEVDARNEPMRRFSVRLRPESVLLASSSALAKSFSESFRTSRSSFNMGNRPVSSMLRISAGESSALQREGETMRDLFWTLFSKLDAVLQGHRVVYEVAGMIAGRSGFKDDLAAKKVSGVQSLIEVWKPIQTEVRTLLHDYLMDDEQSSSSRNAIVSVNDVLRSGRYGRDRSKQLFKLADSGLKAGRRESTVLRRHEDALTAALRASVPGLVSSLDAAGITGVGSSGVGPGSARSNQVIVSSNRQDESYASGGHRLLVKPDAFNVSVLFQPALSFIERVQAVMPSEAAGETSRGFSAFLEEFVQDVFLPQLEEKVQSLFGNATGGADAFQEDSASRRAATRPVVKSVTNIVVLIDSLYSMLRTTPFHRESYSRLIITTVVQYYQRCGERFRDLVTVDTSSSSASGAAGDGGNGHGAGSLNRDSQQYTLSSTWAQRPELYSCLVEMLQAPNKIGAEALAELQAQENRFEMALARSGPPIGFHDMTTSRKKLLALGNLQHSLQWFLSNLSRLKAADEDVPRSKRPQARLSVIDAVRRGEDEGAEEELKLPLSKDMAARYEALPNVYRHLSNVILFTLRIELRVRVFYHLGQAISEGNYVLNDDTAIEPSPHVVDLNAEMANLDDTLSDTLTPENRRFVFTGLSSLMTSLLIGAVQHLRAINRAGVTKMIRNILALQQNLKNIVEMPLEVNFEQCRRFWELLGSCESPEALLAAIRATPEAHKQGFDVYKAALQLMLGLENPPPTLPGQSSGAPTTPGVGPAIAQKGAGTIARRFGGEGDLSRQNFNEYLIELHEVAGQGDDGI